MIRAFRLRDLGILHHYRRHALFLDSLPTLTWGRVLVPTGALLSPFSSLTGVFTSLATSENGRPPLISQVVHSAGSSYAHFTFLAPEAALRSPEFEPLLEHLIQRVGARGAHSLVAEVDEQSRAFGALRKAGFSIYARQRIWRLTKAPAAATRGWRVATMRDEVAVNLLCNNLVPAMVQQVEPAPWNRLNGYLYFEGGDLAAYADVWRGPRGIWLQPFVPLDAGNFDLPLAALMAMVRPSRTQPLYLCLRTYQDWLQSSLEALGAEPGPLQAVMVKRTARPLRATRARQALANNHRSAETTTPIQVPHPMVRKEPELMTYDQTTNYR